MAISALISIDSPSWVVSGQPVNVTCAIRNTGGSDVTISVLQPIILPTLGSNRHSVDFGPGRNKTVPAGGTLNVTWSDSFFVGVQSGQTVWSCAVGAVIYTSDGSVTSATQAQVNVVAPQENQLQPGVYPNPPLAGQVRLDTNYNSGLGVAVGVIAV